MANLMRYATRQFDRLAYYGFRSALKVAQLPKVLSEGEPRILADEVCRPADGTAYAIVVKYAPFRVGDDFLDLLSALRRTGVNAVVVCNGRPREAEFARIREAAHRILVRPNIGRDMGAYRAASLHLSGLAASRVLYFNDSVFYLGGPELDRMVSDLVRSDYDVTGTFENHEYFHHVGTFAFAVSGEVFADPRVAAFWRDYRPYDLRPHAIIRGEIGFARCVKAAGYQIDVVYGVDRLAEQLDAMSVEQLAELLRYAPLTAQRRPPASLLREPRATGGAIRAIRADLQGRRNSPALHRLGERMEREALVSEILRTFNDTSQVHFGFGVYHRVMGAPIVKKDLLSRGVYLEHEVARILEVLPEGQRAGLMRELISRGRPVRMGFTRRFLARHGLI